MKFLKLGLFSILSFLTRSFLTLLYKIIRLSNVSIATNSGLLEVFTTSLTRWPLIYNMYLSNSDDN